MIKGGFKNAFSLTPNTTGGLLGATIGALGIGGKILAENIGLASADTFTNTT